MPDLSVPDIVPAEGKRIPHEDYGPEFFAYESGMRDHASWKLERQQTFDEGDDPSWLAFCQGDWDGVLREFEDSRPHHEAMVRGDAERGTIFHRVRIVDEPLTPYLHWELYSLRIQHESGMPVRVVHGRDIRALEQAGPLPEIVVLGGRILYRVVYTPAGGLDGAIRFTDAALARRWEEFIAELFERGEDITTYFDREVAHLPPPQPTVLR